MGEKGGEDGVAAMAACYKGFDPKAYLQYFYTPPQDVILPWKLACLHRAFTEGDISGDLLVDIGSGPTIYQVLSGCEVFNKVILTDFLEVNREVLKQWLKDEGDCGLDWTPFMQHVCKLEGRQPSAWTQKAARLRAVVSDVLPVDVHSPQPLGPDALPSAGADCLVSCFCLESASADLEAFTRALGNIKGLLKPGGHILLIGTLEGSFYCAAPELKIPMVPLTEAQLCDSLKKTGFTLIRLEVYTVPEVVKTGKDDVVGMFFVKAKKA
ncbi:phenylethanolamine N-methyltransferase-like [Symphorus nematophorus]